MKKPLLIIAILGIILAMSCEEPEVNPFIGTWEHQYNSNVRFVYTETQATGYIFNQGYTDDIYWTGTYTYDDERITVILNQELSHSSMLSWIDGYVCKNF